MHPLIVQSPLTNEWYILTRYVVKGNGVVVASKKYNVTDQMTAILAKSSEVSASLPEED